MFTLTSGNGLSRTQDRTVRHGGGVKLLLKCLQSIQCQYYLVFGVVKTVPLQSFARLRASSPVPSLPSFNIVAPENALAAFSRPRLKRLNNIANGHRYTNIYCIYSVYVVSLLFIICSCARTFHFVVRLFSTLCFWSPVFRLIKPRI